MSNLYYTTFYGQNDYNRGQIEHFFGKKRQKVVQKSIQVVRKNYDGAVPIIFFV